VFCRRASSQQRDLLIPGLASGTLYHAKEAGAFSHLG
jgi:hypothetical protein